MKNILTLLFSILSIVAFAQVPQGLNYQAVARDMPSGEPKQNTNINVKFTILQGSVNGTPVYSENHPIAQTNDFGLFTLTIGQGISADTFSNIDWANGMKFLKVEIDNQLTGTTQLLSVPYALYSHKSKTSDDWANVGDSIIFTPKKVGIGTGGNLVGKLSINQGFSSSNLAKHSLFLGDFNANYNQISSIDNFSGSIKFSGAGWHDGIITFLPHTPDGNSYFQLAGSSSSFNDVKTGLIIRGKVGIGTSQPQRDLDVNGITRSRCVEVTGGCDIVENVNSVQTLQAGEVVVTDPNNPNQVLRSNKAYDRLAIGVVSGAGGVTHGVMLSQEGVLDGNVSFAIAGRVKVKVVGMVNPGDLLTTSNVAGHAMVAKNKRKRDGAIIGKALTIPDEQGLVLMLVTAR